jgi:hypothetical protein
MCPNDSYPLTIDVTEVPGKVATGARLAGDRRRDTPDSRPQGVLLQRLFLGSGFRCE